MAIQEDRFILQIKDTNANLIGVDTSKNIKDGQIAMETDGLKRVLYRTWETLSTPGSTLGTVLAVSAGDNLGDHTATENIQLSDFYLSNDGGDEGLRIDDDGVTYPSSHLFLGDDQELRLGGSISSPKAFIEYSGIGDIISYTSTVQTKFYSTTLLLQGSSYSQLIGSSGSLKVGSSLVDIEGSNVQIYRTGSALSLSLVNRLSSPTISLSYLDSFDIQQQKWSFKLDAADGYSLNIINDQASNTPIKISAGSATITFTATSMVNVASDQLRLTHTNGLVYSSFTIDANGYLKISPSGGRIAVGDVDPDSNMHIWNATAGTVAAVAGTMLTVENSSDAFISVLVPSASVGGLVVGTPTDNDSGKFVYGSDEGGNFWSLVAGGNDVLHFSASSTIGFTTIGYVSSSGGARVSFLADNLELKGGSASIVKIESGHDLKLGVSAGFGLPPANRTLAIKDSSGTTLYLLASTFATS